jgi:hypothetical protein
MMVTYTLQSYDKGIMSAATQFGFNTDLGLTVLSLGTRKAGVAITDNQKYSNASMIFYIGYLCGTYPDDVFISALLNLPGPGVGDLSSGAQ